MMLAEGRVAPTADDHAHVTGIQDVQELQQPPACRRLSLKRPAIPHEPTGIDAVVQTTAWKPTIPCGHAIGYGLACEA